MCLACQTLRFATSIWLCDLMSNSKHTIRTWPRLKSALTGVAGIGICLVGLIGPYWLFESESGPALVVRWIFAGAFLVAAGIFWIYFVGSSFRQHPFYFCAAVALWVGIHRSYTDTWFSLSRSYLSGGLCFAFVFVLLISIAEHRGAVNAREHGRDDSMREHMADTAAKMQQLQQRLRDNPQLAELLAEKLMREEDACRPLPADDPVGRVLKRTTLQKVEFRRQDLQLAIRRNREEDERHSAALCSSGAATDGPGR